jgi:Zn-dependent protease with chaperone function
LIPAYWTSPIVAALWQVMLHSSIAAAIFTLWARRWPVPPGRVRRRMLETILVLPWITALVPGRGGFEFREQSAWLDSRRLLAIPLPGGLQLYHLALAMAAVTVGLSVWQEILPMLRRWCRGGKPEDPPKALERRVRELPGWRRCRVRVCAEPGLHVATFGRPGRPRLVLSREVLELPAADLDAVLRHENAHWHGGRWWRTHLLFGARLLQLFNPVALWAFREYTVETEIACDADAADGHDPRPLARVLLRLYEDSATSGPGTRSTLRRRVDVLLGRIPRPPDGPSTAAVWTAGALLLVTLPWIV